MISDSISHPHPHPQIYYYSHKGMCIARWRLALDFGWAWTALDWIAHNGRLDRKDMLVMARRIGRLSR